MWKNEEEKISITQNRSKFLTRGKWNQIKKRIEEKSNPILFPLFFFWLFKDYWLFFHVFGDTNLAANFHSEPEKKANRWHEQYRNEKDKINGNNNVRRWCKRLNQVKNTDCYLIFNDYIIRSASIVPCAASE